MDRVRDLSALAHPVKDAVLLYLKDVAVGAVGTYELNVLAGLGRSVRINNNHAECRLVLSSGSL